ncbi:MAG: tRNA (guanosine(46)-N7)-methyltransferase TrmB [Piscirickettsiaceae bacterium]|nr:tRNA (guanosine(46)-N7)-methyltransferase TrmB [Piscirickettsiaceae bacterium]
MIEDKPLRTVRSFVRRERKLTPGQRRALNDLWSQLGIDNSNKLLNLDELFNRNAPKVLEIGFGNGKSLAKMAAEQPDQDFIGVEVYRPGIGQLLNMTSNLGLNNLKIAYNDALELLNHQIMNNSLDRVQIYFPDPWHKKRHHKRRIIQDQFIEVLANKIRSGGYLHMATDLQNYANQMLDYVSNNNNFINLGDGIGCIDNPYSRPMTKFEHRGLRLGHTIWDLLFKRI